MCDLEHQFSTCIPVALNDRCVVRLILVRHARKPGPKSFLEASKPPKGMGFKARMVHRYITEVKSDASREADRKGFYAAWKYGGKLLRKWKVKKPGEFDETNAYGGVLWGGVIEWNKSPITADRIGRLFEECALNRRCSDSSLTQISKMLSTLYLLETGESSKNWKTLPGLKKTLKHRNRVETVSTVLPDNVPSWMQLVKVFTTEWRPDADMPLLKFLISGLMTWDSHVLGSRSNIDIKKIKDSTRHWFGTDCWFTEFVDGRAKLPLEKSGTRPWRAWRICLCPKGKHVPPPPDFECSFNDEGNSSADLSGICTTCPLFIGQLLDRMQRFQEWPLRCYRKAYVGTKRMQKGRTIFGKKNFGPVQDMVKNFFRFQGVPLVSSNSGRKCLAGWASKTRAPYRELLHIMGDLEKVWRANYQPDLPVSGGYDVRKQSTNPAIATAALRRFRKLCGRAPPPEPPPPGLDKTGQVVFMLCKQLGYDGTAREIFMS